MVLARLKNISFDLMQSIKFNISKIKVKYKDGKRVLYSWRIHQSKWLAVRAEIASIRLYFLFVMLWSLSFHISLIETRSAKYLQVVEVMFWVRVFFPYRDNIGTPYHLLIVANLTDSLLRGNFHGLVLDGCDGSKSGQDGFPMILKLREGRWLASLPFLLSFLATPSDQVGSNHSYNGGFLSYEAEEASGAGLQVLDIQFYYGKSFQE